MPEPAASPAHPASLCNWSRNVAFSATGLARPRSLDELQQLVSTTPRLHALGAGHSFSPVADTGGLLVSLDAMPPLLEIDAIRRRARVGAATRYADLAPALHSAGMALANLASLPHLSVAGACATATHGSGDRNGGLASQVSALRLVGPDGEIVTMARGERGLELAGAVVACGALGVVTELELDLVPAFDVRQTVHEDLPFERAVEELDGLLSSAYSVSLFVDWRRPHVAQVWRKERLEPGVEPAAAPAELLGAVRASGPRHPIPGFPPEPCTPQLGSPGPWHERLPHFRADRPPSAAGDELQSEYFVARAHASQALEALGPLSSRLAPLVQVSEVRSIAADRLWLSPYYGRPSVGLHFTWRHDVGRVQEVLPEVEAVLAPFEARPHWGKLFAMPAEAVRAGYERLGDFEQLRTSIDPGGKFAGAFSRRYLAAAS